MAVDDGDESGCIDDFDLEAGELLLRTLEGGDRDVVFVPPDVIELLRTHVGTDGPLFPGMNSERLGTRQVARRLAEWAARAGLRHLLPCALLHAFEQRLYDQTVLRPSPMLRDRTPHQGLPAISQSPARQRPGNTPLRVA